MMGRPVPPTLVRPDWFSSGTVPNKNEARRVNLSGPHW
jgi:hypothetical protein